MPASSRSSSGRNSRLMPIRIGRPWIIPLELSRRFEPSIRNRVENQRDCSPFRALLTMNGARRASGQAGIALTTERTK